MLLLDNEDVQRVFDVNTCLDTLHEAYLAQARGEVVTRLLTQTYVPLPESDLAYCLKTMEGSLPGTGYMALRLTSDIVSESSVNGLPRRQKLPRGPSGTYCGLVLLFSLRELAPVAILHDGHIQLNRVACTSALATKLLARENAASLAIIGSGEQAWAHLITMRIVRHIARVSLFSPNVERRQAFVRRAREELGIDISASDSAQQAVEGADIVVTATNSSVPVLSGQWLEAGTHVVSIVTGDEKTRRRELDDEVFRRARVVVAHSKAAAMQQQHGDLIGPIAAAALRWDLIYDLSELVAGKAPGRRSAGDITVFKNNVGLGLQFAAVASRVYESARRAGIGRSLPDEWFVQKMKS